MITNKPTAPPPLPTSPPTRPRLLIVGATTSPPLSQQEPYDPTGMSCGFGVGDLVIAMEYISSLLTSLQAVEKTALEIMAEFKSDLDTYETISVCSNAMIGTGIFTGTIATRGSAMANYLPLGDSPMELWGDPLDIDDLVTCYHNNYGQDRDFWNGLSDELKNDSCRDYDRNQDTWNDSLNSHESHFWSGCEFGSKGRNKQRFECLDCPDCSLLSGDPKALEAYQDFEMD